MTGHSLIVSAITAAHPTDGADRMHRAKNIPHPCLYRTDGVRDEKSWFCSRTLLSG